MLSSEECRHRVRLCQASAQAARVPEVRAVWLSLADSYRIIASIEDVRRPDGTLGSMKAMRVFLK
jgi:hypothetical protein